MRRLLTSLWRGLRRVVGAIVRAVDVGRRVVGTLVVLALLVVLGALAVGSWKSAVEPGSVLVLAPRGAMTQERPGADGLGMLRRLADEEPPGVQLRDWVQALEHAARDDRIGRVLLLLDEFEGAGLPTLREAAAALQAFKASGKPVIAWGADYDQRRYLLAAHATRVVMHPMGAVQVTGLARQRLYYRDALDRLGVKANLVRVGQYKSAGEPFIANGPSPQAQQADANVFGDLWQQITQDLERTRGLPPGAIAGGIEALPGALQAVGGDLGKLALQQRLVDELKSFEDLRRELIEAAGAADERTTFRQVGLQAYLDDVRKPVRGKHVAVVVAEGEIGDGQAPPGRIGGASTARLIRELAADDDVRAIVLRVNSPGGSAYGSELVRHQLELARAAGKPVVVSMGDVAASGGYWISLAADRVLADPATITGSIGVFGMLPTAEGLMERLSLHVGGYRSTWLAGAPDVRQPLDPRFQQLVQSAIGRIYEDFVAKSAAARGLRNEQVHEVAQGRIWTGRQALEHRLVDELGGLSQALQVARRLAGDEALPLRYRSRERPRWQALLEMFSARAAQALGVAVRDELGPVSAAWPGDAASRALLEDLAWLRDVVERRKPFDAAAHCLCAAP